MAAPGFSIIIPTYQRRETVCDAVRALARSGYGGVVEVIVVVDGSTDGTAPALAALPCPFSLRIVEQANAGAARARNAGAAMAAHEILLFLDDDMLAAPDLIERHAAAHAQGAEAVFGDIPLSPDSSPGFLSRGVGLWIAERSARLSAGAPLGIDDLLTGQLSVRRSVFEALGGFDTRFTEGGSFGNEDLDFGLRLLGSHDVRYEPRAISHQRYIVAPAQNLRQFREAGRADTVLAAKHPRRIRELRAARQADSARIRLVLRPLAAVPGLANALGGLAITVGKRIAHRGRAGDRVAARLFYFARDMAYWAGVREGGGLPDSRTLRVLCLHAIADLSGDPVLAPYGIAPERFARLIADLQARGYRFVTPDWLLAAIEDGAMLPRRALLLTFDDCYADLADAAAAILMPRGIPALAFAVSGLVGASNEWDQSIGAGRLALLDAAGLRALAAAGIEIGCHGRTHRALPQTDADALEAETRGAAEDMQALGLPRPRFFAYPYGEADARSARAAETAGFRAAFALARSQAGRPRDRFRLARCELRSGDSTLRLHWNLWRNRLRYGAPA